MAFHGGTSPCSWHIGMVLDAHLSSAHLACAIQRLHPRDMCAYVPKLDECEFWWTAQNLMWIKFRCAVPASRECPMHG